MDDDNTTEDNDVPLSSDQGAIVFGEEGLYVLVPSEPSKDLPPDRAEAVFHQVVDAMTFVLYALDREDWMTEFTKIAQEQAKLDLQKDKEKAEKEKLKKRSHLTVVK